jgi:hypothetical protein
MSAPKISTTDVAPRDCYGRLACAVIGQAAKEYFGCDVLLAAEARSFFFGKSKANVIVREHWFAQAGMTVPPPARLLADLHRWNKSSRHGSADWQGDK